MATPRSAATSTNNMQEKRENKKIVAITKNCSLKKNKKVLERGAGRGKIN
jgi:hypothetical protein